MKRVTLTGIKSMSSHPDNVPLLQNLLTYNSTLAYLDLSDCNLTTNQFIDIISFLRYNTSLTCLKLGNSSDSTFKEELHDEHANMKDPLSWNLLQKIIIILADENTTLKHLCVSTSDFKLDSREDAGHQQACIDEISLSLIQICSALKQNRDAKVVGEDDT